MNHKALGFLCSVGLISLVPSLARAQATAGALQLALGTDLVTYNKTSTTTQTTPVERTDDFSTTRWGFSDSSSVLVEGGYGLGDSLVLGGFLGLGGWSQKQESTVRNVTDDQGTTSRFDLFLAPKIDYMLLPGQNIRPFFGGAFGIQYRSQSIETPVAAGTRITNDTSVTGLALMARVGARFFLTPGFSVDPAFMFLWVPTASGSQEAGNLKYDVSANGYTLGLTVAASGWIGL